MVAYQIAAVTLLIAFSVLPPVIRSIAILSAGRKQFTPWPEWFGRFLSARTELWVFAVLAYLGGFWN